MDETQPNPPQIELNQYLAIQQRVPWENSAVAAEALCATAKMMGTLFRRVEVLDVIKVGGKPFVRMRTDLARDRVQKVLLALVGATDRAVVYSLPDGGYEAKFPASQLGGRTAMVSVTLMHSLPRGQQFLFRGPKIKNWRAQFSSS